MASKYLCFCGERQPHRFYKHSTKRCRSCHNADLKERGLAKKRRAIDFLGGRCSRCGYAEHYAALQIHHTIPALKSKTYDRYRGWSWERLKAELAHCIALCANCHAVEHCGKQIEVQETK